MRDGALPLKIGFFDNFFIGGAGEGYKHSKMTYRAHFWVLCRCVELRQSFGDKLDKYNV